MTMYGFKKDHKDSFDDTVTMENPPCLVPAIIVICSTSSFPYLSIRPCIYLFDVSFPANLLLKKFRTSWDV